MVSLYQEKGTHMSYHNSIYLGYGFFVESNEENLRTIYNLQNRLGKNSDHFDPNAFLNEFYQPHLFPHLTVEEYSSEEDDTSQIFVLIKESVIHHSGRLLPSVAPVKLTFPQDDSWNEGMDEITLLGTLFGLPAENTPEQPDAYGWVFLNLVM